MSAFQRVMKKGQTKVKTTPNTKALLCELTEHNHKLIAKIIAKWLDDDGKNKV
ncbi:hypothetical protein J3L16_11105 [Alteromonas sp. 5E99-2]|uniref:hypothetical protein n=1 Tax=Alteromonas sp. 5E99-2 TaxID=2817683 RepID=UPI001A99B16E|nr:hypothetical protein [Alteromonas sp. 5E99-2]MBO1256228.1 hypothetical protein [Alteromonas sp. 5E99-2]